VEVNMDNARLLMATLQIALAGSLSSEAL